MPIYEFECSACQTRFERLQKLSDADPDTCPDCGKPSVRRRLTAPAFRLSGSGWYETDFKKEGDVKRNLASSEAAPKPESTQVDAPKAEPAKPAAKAEPSASS